MARKPRMILAAALGILSALLVLAVYAKLRPAQVAVVQVTQAVQPFTALTGSSLREVRIDANTAQALFPDAYTSLAQVEGKMTVRLLRPGEILLTTDPDIVDASQPERMARSSTSLSPRIKEGYRAIGIQASGVAVAPGDFIDLHYVSSDEGPVRTYPAVQVVAAQGSTLWVVVRQEEVTDLLQAQARGRLYVAVAPPPGGGP